MTIAILSALLIHSAGATAAEPNDRLRLIVETDAGGDPDDEQSLVRFLLYANEWDVEGIIANRREVRRPENRNPRDSGLEIVRGFSDAYEKVYPRLREHDKRFPAPDVLRQRTVAGYDDTGDAVGLIIEVVDRDDPRPVWFLNWGTDAGSAKSNLKRALDRVLAQRGREGYAKFKRKILLSSDDQFDEHTTRIEPLWRLWVYPFYPNMDGGRWYHRFGPLTATAGGGGFERLDADVAIADKLARCIAAAVDFQGRCRPRPDGDGDIDICSKPWMPGRANSLQGRMHVDFLENLTNGRK